MTVVDLLRRLEQINRDDVAAAAEFGPLRMGPTGEVVPDVLCVDGTTRLATSPQLREFYGYALWWEHCSIELKWCDPLEIRTLMSEPPIRAMIESDIRHGDLVIGGLGMSNTVLFAIDTPAAPFDRAYLVLGEEPEPRVVYAGSEVSEYEDLHAYLTSLVQTLAC